MKKKFFSSIFIFFLTVTLSFAAKIDAQLMDVVAAGTFKDIKKLCSKYEYSISDSFGKEKNTLLMIALENNREYKIIKWLIWQGVSVRKTNINKQTALMFACEYSNDPKVIEYVLKKSKLLKSSREKFIQMLDANDENCFDFAYRNEDHEMAVSLLEKYSYNPYTYKDAAKEIPVHESKKPLPPQEENLTEENQSNSVQAEENAAPLENAVSEIKTETPLVSGSDLVVVPAVVFGVKSSENGETVASDITETDKGTVIVKENVVEIASNIESPSVEKETAVTGLFDMNEKTSDSPVKKTEYLFDDSDLENNNAVPLDDYVEPKNFIENADKKDKFGRTALMTAANKGQISLIKDLLYSGADIQAKDHDGWTPLMFAARYQENPEVTNLLVKSGAVISTQNKHGINALKLAAAFNKNPEVLAAMLKNRSVSEKDVRSAFVYAIQSESSVSILNVFLEKGVQINVSFDGKTPLMYAADCNSSTEIIAWLLENGANASLKTSKGKTAFDFARENSKLPHDGVYWALNEMKDGE